MSIEWFRDLVVCIFGLGATVVVIFLAVLAFLLYRRLRPILDSVKSTTKTVENFSSCVEAEVARPLAQVAAFAELRVRVGADVSEPLHGGEAESG